MCDRHAFQFDVDKAYQDQLVAALEASPEHPLSRPKLLVNQVYTFCFAVVCLCTLDKPGSFVPG